MQTAQSVVDVALDREDYRWNLSRVVKWLHIRFRINPEKDKIGS